MYRERMLEKLQGARESVEKVKKNFPDNLKIFLKMGLERDGIYKNIEFAIQSIIDICSMLVKEFELGVPEEELDIFEELKEGKILSKGVVGKIIEMRGFRNFLVHRYGRLNDKIAYRDIKQGLPDFDTIFKALENAIGRRKD